LKSEIETAQKKADKIEAVQRQMDEINQKLDQIKILQHGQIKQTDLVQEVEQQFDGKSIAEILKENKNLSIRALAKKLNVGKSTIAQWRKKILSATGGR
jgi:DNA-binding transcriptional regulator YiaG